MNTQQLCFRHGEICFKKINKLPNELIKENTNQFLKGSHGNLHTFDNGELYLKNVDEYIFGYFKAENTKLMHPEHASGNGELKIALLPDGIYELRKQQEWINNEMKPVID